MICPASACRTASIPLTENAYEHCVRLQYFNSTPEKSGFEEDMTPQRDITDIFRNGWSAGEKELIWSSLSGGPVPPCNTAE